MRAVVLLAGGSNVLTFADVPDPVAGEEEVVVQVRASALNRADLLQAERARQAQSSTNEIPGLEFAGTVLAAGVGATRWSVGDEVMGIQGGGCHAQRVCVHQDQLMRVPRAVGVADAAAIPEAFMTAFDALVVLGTVRRGEWVLVSAGASGVGTAAIQIANALGAHVAATCSSAKVDACHMLGAEVVIDRTVHDVVPAIRAATNGVGADLIIDLVGGDDVAHNVRAVAMQGRIVVVGLMGGRSANIDLELLLGKRVSLIGTVLKTRPIAQKIKLTRQFTADMLPLFDTGVLRPVIDRRFPLEKIAAAHQYMAANASIGKIMLDVSA